MTVPNSNFDQLSAITERYFVPKLADNVFVSIPLLNRLMKKGKKVQGGTKIIVPLGYATNASVEWYSGAATLSTTDQDVITSAEFDWKQLHAPIVISRLDELKNNGPAQMVDFVQSKMQIAEKSMKETLATGVFNAGSTSNAIIGARAFVATSGTYGNISMSSYSWWQSNVDSSTTSLSIAAMQGLYGDASEGSEQPSVVITTQDIFDDYYSLLQPQQRFQDVESAKGGFTSLMFNGKPIIVDSKCPAGYMFMFNEDYLDLYVHPQEDFRFEPFAKPINQNVKIAHIYWQGALCSSNNRFHAGFSALT